MINDFLQVIIYRTKYRSLAMNFPL